MNRKYRIDLETNGSGRVLRVKVWWPGEIQPTDLTNVTANGTIEDVFSYLGETINSEDDGPKETLLPTIVIDWSRRGGWRVHCSVHGWLRIPPQSTEEDDHDLAVISGWEHEVIKHNGDPHAFDQRDLLNPERWPDAIARLRSL